MKFSYLLQIMIITLGTLLLSCDSKSGKRRKPNYDEYFYVVKVVDGDTFWVKDDVNGKIKVRLIGIDAPESRKTFKKEVGFFGKEAKQYLTNMLMREKVKIVCDVDSFDQYGRTLAYVYLQDGVFVNAEVIKNGYAMIMTIPPNVKYADMFFKLQEQAREKKRGIWGIDQ